MAEDLGLQGRIEKFSSECLAGEKPDLGQYNFLTPPPRLNCLHSLLNDLGYKEEKGLFSRASSKGIEMVINRDYVHSEKDTNAWSYLALPHPADLLTFREKYSSYCTDSVRTQLEDPTIVGGIIGLVFGGVIGGAVCAASGTPETPENPIPGIICVVNLGILGGIIGYLKGRSDYKAEGKRMEEFVNQYKAQITTGKEALQKALTIL